MTMSRSETPPLAAVAAVALTCLPAGDAVPDFPFGGPFPAVSVTF
jgi:hypothetical protein